MGFAPFFDRVVAAAEGHLAASRESLELLLRDRVVSVICPTTPGPESIRWIGELSVNLLSRLFPRLHLGGHPLAVAALEALARGINPSIEFANEPVDDLTIVCGANVGAGLGASANGWVASVATENVLLPAGPANPYSSAAAACLAVSEIVRRAFGLRRMGSGETHRLSLLDYGSQAGSEMPLGTVELGDAAFIGLGAVGQGALWALGRHKAARGNVWLVDDEVLDLSNLQRYVLGSIGDVGSPKTALAMRALAETSIQTQAHALALDRFADQFAGGFPIPTLCVSVDNVPARRAVQALLPQLAINAYTGEGALGVSWHRFDSEAACLACLYHPRSGIPSQADLVGGAFGLTPQRAAMLLAGRSALEPHELAQAAKKLGLTEAQAASWRGRPVGDLFVQVICGGADLPIPGRGHSEIVPLAHQSALAGVLMAVELVKRSTPALAPLCQKETLAAWYDVRRPAPRRWIEPRTKELGCICGDPIYQQAFREKWLSQSAQGSSE